MSWRKHFLSFAISCSAACWVLFLTSSCSAGESSNAKESPRKSPTIVAATATPTRSLEIEPSGPSPDLATSGHGVLVGISTDGYAIANHQQWHLLFHDGWWVFYKDDSGHIQAAHLQSDDSVSHRQIVSHQPIARGFSVINHHDTVYLVYTDTNGQYLFLRSGTIVDNAIELSDPVTVVQQTHAFAVQYPSVAIDQRGQPWIVYRSDELDQEPFPIWITTPTGTTLSAWNEPVRVSTGFEDSHSGFATSATIAVLVDKLVVISSGNPASPSSRFLFQYESPSIFPPVWNRSIVAKDFGGTHDYSLTVTDDMLHLAYVIATDPGLRMVYRHRKLGTDWSEAIDIGPTVQHSTALTVDRLNRPWVFHVPPADPTTHILGKDEDERIFVRVFGEVDRHKCVITIAAEHQIAYPWNIPWIGSVYGASDRQALIWTEGTEGQYRVMFRALQDIGDPHFSGCVG